VIADANVGVVNPCVVVGIGISLAIHVCETFTASKDISIDVESHEHPVAFM
jgi:hypothetical protein